MAKSKKIEKETRKLMESSSDIVKKKGNRYKFKCKKKKMKKVKQQCVHWIYRKGKEQPLVTSEASQPDYWRCTLCEHEFPIRPAELPAYIEAIDRAMEYVDQMLFWSVKLGGDKDDIQMFMRLKADLPRFKKVCKQILKRVNQRQAWEKNRENSDVLAQFDAYSAFNYKQI